MRCLLIYPPFASIGRPYPSVPILAAYLRSLGVEVTAVDLNAEFYYRFLSSSSITGALGWAEARLRELDSMETLGFTRLVEYGRLARALLGAARFRHDIPHLFDGEAAGNVMEAARAAVSVASCPHFPDALETAPSFEYVTPFNECSSRDILSSVGNQGMLSGIVEEVLGEAIEGRTPDLAGISVPYPDQVLPAFETAAALRRLAPDAAIVLGGPWVSCQMRDLSNPDIFDIVDGLVLDDGEAPLKSLIDGRGKPDVAGLVYRSNGEVKRNASPAPVGMRDQHLPDFSMLPLDRYVLPRRLIPVPFRLSRGCPWARCAFCKTGLPLVSHGEQPPVDFLYERLRRTLDETGSRVVRFSDEAASPDVLEELCGRMISDGLDVSWIASVRFDPRLTLKRCNLFREAGCRNLILGMEAYDDRVLSLMKKGITTKVIDSVLSSISWAGLSTSVCMIVGFPGETEEEAVAGFERIREFCDSGLVTRYRYRAFQIVAHSPVAERPEEYGVTRIEYPEGCDLAPSTCRFEGPGMSRETALDLEERFNRGMSADPAEWLKGDTGGTVSRIPLRDGTLDMNYDLAEIAAAVAGLRDRNMSYGDWLAEGERKIGLTRRAR